MKKLRPSSLAWSLCLIGIVAVLIGSLIQPSQSPLKESPIASAIPIGGKFTLVDQDGKNVTEKSWPGKYLLLYFGFTHCPDVCPLGLNKVAEAMNALPPSIAEEIQPVFITVDPARDTAKDLKTYVALFHPKLVGLTGTQEQIDHVTKLFKVYAQKQGDGPDYMVNHSDFKYLIDPEQKLAGLYGHDVTADEMAKDIQKTVEKE